MFFKQKKSGKTTLVIDFGSSSVGAAIVLRTKGEMPKVVFSTRSFVTPQNDFERNSAVLNISQSIENTLKSTLASKFHIDSTHVFFSSPWCISKIKKIEKSYPAPISITQKIIEDLITEHLQEISVSGETVDKKIIQTKLNGYETSSPHNKKANKIEISFFVGEVQKDVLDIAHRTLEKYFHLRDNKVSLFSLASFSTISSILPNENEFLIVDVRGNATDISSIADGALSKCESFAQGKNSLIKTVSEKFNHSATAALSLISTAFQNNSDASTQQSVSTVAETFKKNWLEEYSKTIKNIFGGIIVPQKIFLITDHEIEIFFENILNGIDDGSTIHPIKHLHVKDYLEKNSVETDQFLALESIFVTIV